MAIKSYLNNKGKELFIVRVQVVSKLNPAIRVQEAGKEY